MAVDVTTGSSFAAAVPKMLFQTRLRGWTSRYDYASSRDNYAVSADGRRLFVNAASDPKPSPITVILNWTAGLKR
jgi:hypothetical protein